MAQSFRLKTETVKLNSLQRTAGWKSKFYYVYYQKAEVGYLSQDEGQFKIRLQVVKPDIHSDGNPNCVWRWAIIAIPVFKEPKQAIDWLNANEQLLLSKFTLYKRENGNS